MIFNPRVEFFLFSMAMKTITRRKNSRYKKINISSLWHQDLGIKNRQNKKGLKTSILTRANAAVFLDIIIFSSVYLNYFKFQFIFVNNTRINFFQTFHYNDNILFIFAKGDFVLHSTAYFFPLKMEISTVCPQSIEQ